MEQDKKENSTQQPEPETGSMISSEQGRLPETGEQPTTGQNADISQVDQQEGQMNNGELGGNFHSTGTEDK